MVRRRVSAIGWGEEVPPGAGAASGGFSAFISWDAQASPRCGSSGVDSGGAYRNSAEPTRTSVAPSSTATS